MIWNLNIRKKSVGEIYSNDKYGLSIKCPNGWKTKRGLLSKMLARFIDSKTLFHFVDPRGGGINLIAGPTYGTQETIEDLENFAIRNVRRLKGEMESLKRIKVDNIEAIEAIYSALGLKTKKVGFVKDHIEYIITCGIKPNLFEEYKLVFDECIQSFKFNKQD